MLLLSAGVVASVLPAVPAGLLSLAGVYSYWALTGFSDPGPLLLLSFTTVGVTAVGVEQFAGPISAAAGGASPRTSALSAVVGLVLFAVTGPVGILLGVVGTVFTLEYHETGDVEASASAATTTILGMLASAGVLLLLTLSLLVGVVLFVVLL
nr:DUF456 domain-containing protein [Salinirubrum litoreum]